MKTYKKINIYFGGEYVCSTNQSKRCKDAVASYLDKIEYYSHAIGGIGLVNQQILKYPHLLKANFDKGVNQ
jgi:hypothetical protein